MFPTSLTAIYGVDPALGPGFRGYRETPFYGVSRVPPYTGFCGYPGRRSGFRRKGVKKGVKGCKKGVKKGV